MKKLDVALGWLLLLGLQPEFLLLLGNASGRSYASLLVPMVLAGLLSALLNFGRITRPEAPRLAWVSFAGCLVWIIVAIAFGLTVATPLNLWTAYHVVVASGLAAFSLRTAIGGPEEATAAAAGGGR